MPQKCLLEIYQNKLKIFYDIGLSAEMLSNITNRILPIVAKAMYANIIHTLEIFTWLLTMIRYVIMCLF